MTTEDLPLPSISTEVSELIANDQQATTSAEISISLQDASSESIEADFPECTTKDGKNYVLKWKFYSFKDGKDVHNVRPQVVDCFGVYKDSIGSSHVARSKKAMIPELNHLRIAMVKMSKQLDWSEEFDPEIDYEKRIPARMSIFDVLMHHVPSGDLKEVTSKCQIFCKTGVLQGIGERLYWKRELKLNACYLEGALFILIDMDFAMEDLRNRADSTPHLNKSSYLGQQFPKEITQAASELPKDAHFMEFRTVVETAFPCHTVLSTGEIDAIDEEDQLIEIKCLKGGFDDRFWKERSCKLFLQMFFSGSRRCVQGHSRYDNIVDIREIDLERLADKGANLPDRLFPWYKDDVFRFIDEFLDNVYKELSKTPKIVFNITKDEGHSRFFIEQSEVPANDFFPIEFLMHFNIDL
ncbi:hypothetical protein QR680_015077 [Steinernema hermaphroditum]|uniref:Decapping nuclease n=1 Tax=Steinernema hermaphroditum TaxID=289476 RepID=A0AA39ICI2_9BILA|nr:hypothetical protein QR680_015077 [Steinernema hermaphroditum]